MRPDDFFVDDLYPGPAGFIERRLNTDLLTRVRSGPITELEDIEVAVPLAILVHEELERYGTDGSNELDDRDMRVAIAALRAVNARMGVGPEIPFRDLSSFRSYWLRNDARGSWEARRLLLRQTFEPMHDQLAELEQRSLSATLVDPISPHHRTGWSAVDTEISELRRHFQNARTAQDYRNVGLDCVAVTEALSAQVYDPARHQRDGETEPPVANTKQRIERFVEDAAAGPDNATLRKLARVAIEYAQHVKHSSTPTRREAGIAADAVIQLANIMPRLESES